MFYFTAALKEYSWHLVYHLSRLPAQQIKTQSEF